MTRPRIEVIAAVTLGWSLLLYIIPLGVGLGVGAVPLRLVSSGVLFDQMSVSLAGYRFLVWSPVIAGTIFSILALNLPPTRFNLALGIAGATIAATLLLIGGVVGIGPGSTLLVATELRWVWKICAGAAGLAIGLVGPQLIKARAEDHALDFPAIRRDMLLTGVVLGGVILLVAPGPLLGKAMTGAGSWFGSLVWVLGL